MARIRESELPGIGRKYQFETDAGERLVVVVHGDGTRELYHERRDDPDACVPIARMEDAEARQIAGIIGGLSYRPRDLAAVEEALDELVVEWLQLRAGSRVIGRTIGGIDVRKQTGAAIVAVVGPGNARTINPGPEQILVEGMTLVVIGERGQVHAVRSLISSGG